MSANKPTAAGLLPEADPNGYIPTMNKNGWMTTTIHGPGALFIEHAANVSGWSLDIGAAYGIHTLAAIKRGARVVANDIEPRHLKLLQKQVPAELSLNLRTRAGAFTRIKLPKCAFDAVLASNVLCFMDGPTVERAADKITNLLRPGGKAFIRTPTPFARHLDYIRADYEQRKAAGEKWPGCFEDMDARRPANALQYFTGLMHFMVPEQLQALFEARGFQVETCEVMKAAPAAGVAGVKPKLDGREWSVLVARKS
jgi:SAM-dependent methyltransferase